MRFPALMFWGRPFCVMELQDLHFKHTLASGRAIRLIVYRTVNARPRVVADSVCDFSMNELQEYQIWRESVVATMMSILTPGEIEGCAAYGRQKVRGDS